MYELQNMNPSFPVTIGVYKSRSWGRPHWHENIELLNITSGTARAVVGNEEIYVSQGDTIVVNAYEMHEIFTDSLVEYRCLIADIEFIKRFDIDLTECVIKSKLHDDTINLLFDETEKLRNEMPLCYEAEICANALKIISQMIRKFKVEGSLGVSGSRCGKSAMVKEAVSYMKKHLESQITLDDISTNLGFNKYYLCRTFKEITGIPIKKMLNFLRCNEAKRLIMTTERTINEISLDCGYSSLSYFTKTYKGIIGCLPSDTQKHFSQKKQY